MKKRIFFIMSVLIGSMIAHNSYGMELEQISIKPVMPQQQLLAQKDALEGLVKYVWEKCLRALDEIFPGLIDESEKNLSIKYDFEKLPKTDENILLIKQTVQSVIIKTPILFMHFNKQTKATQEQSLKWMLERMIGSALIELLLQDASRSLDWCTCTAEYKRITLALLIVNEAREKFSDKNQRIVYTSFGSGDLLQDYVMLSELLGSHTNVLVNLIDLDQPDLSKSLAIDFDQDVHIFSMRTAQENADMIDSFKIKIAQIISTKKSSGTDYNFEVNLYKNAYEYIARVQKNSNEKSNILTLVDPGASNTSIADFPSLANVINVWIDQEMTPVFTLFLPRHHGVQLYELTGLTGSIPLTISAAMMRYIRLQLSALITQTGANKQYTPRLVEAFLDRTILNQQITDAVLMQIGFPQLMYLKTQTEDNNSYLVRQHLSHNPTPIKLGNAIVLLSWGSDAYISFQDLIWSALAPNALVYSLDTSPEPGEEEALITKVNPEQYKKADVITPNSGVGLTSVPELQEELLEEQYGTGIYKRIL